MRRRMRRRSLAEGRRRSQATPRGRVEVRESVELRPSSDTGFWRFVDATRLDPPTRREREALGDFQSRGHMTKANATRIAAAMLTVLPALAAEATTVARASCRGGDKAESGLQGLTTQAEIDSGAAKAGFNCNTDIVGQYQGEGASWQLTAWKNCAYFDQRLNSAEANPGTVVVDVSDPKNPKPTMWLAEPAFIDPWESLKVNAARQLLAGGQRPTGTTFPGTGFSIYDISQDCAHPTLKSSIIINGSLGHTGQWAPDGKTYYITPLQNTISIEAIDTTDPANPAL